MLNGIPADFEAKVGQCVAMIWSVIMITDIRMALK